MREELRAGVRHIQAIFEADAELAVDRDHRLVAEAHAGRERRFVAAHEVGPLVAVEANAVPHEPAAPIVLSEAMMPPLIGVLKPHRRLLVAVPERAIMPLLFGVSTDNSISLPVMVSPKPQTASLKLVMVLLAIVVVDPTADQNPIVSLRISAFRSVLRRSCTPVALASITTPTP